jgi:hypothetical protein
MEFIGLLVSLVLFFALSVVLGCVFGAVAWLILGSRKGHRRYGLIAACLPPVFAAYMVACAFVFAVAIPGEGDRIFFGDVYEVLPNGFTLKAMAKMRDYALIESDSPKGQGVSGVGSLAVNGPQVFGAYSNNHGYFAFDTRSGANLEFDTVEELSRYAGRPIHLIETFAFRSSDRTRRYLRGRNA